MHSTDVLISQLTNVSKLALNWSYLALRKNRTGLREIPMLNKRLFKLPKQDSQGNYYRWFVEFRGGCYNEDIGNLAVSAVPQNIRGRIQKWAELRSTGIP